MNRHVIISGCSGGGKSTLLAELATRGYVTVPEPGRRIIAQEKASGGRALPWLDLAAFARRAIEVAIQDRKAAARTDGWVFFDRGLIDAAAALEQATGELVVKAFNQIHPYHRCAFLAPSWQEIYHRDEDRKHGFLDAIAEYERLLTIYPRLGYEIVILPKVSVLDRADFMIDYLEHAEGVSLSAT